MAGIKTGQLGSWVVAGVGLAAGVVIFKTAMSFVKGFVPIPIADF